MTNVLMKTNCDYIFSQKHKLIPLDELMVNDRSCFESDPQMNLRFLTLINIAFKKSPQESDDNKMVELVEYILMNIFKFRNILDSKKSYFYDVPSLLIPDEPVDETTSALKV